MSSSVSFSDLQSAVQHCEPPLVIDVRRAPAFKAATETIKGALRRDPEAASTWIKALPKVGTVVVYCAHGHEVSQNVAAALNAEGIKAGYLQGGIEAGWKAHGGALDRKPAHASTRWVTRERPKIDRIACPWLIARFIDKEAEFLYVPAEEVLKVARQHDAIPYDVQGAAFSHNGELCSFDAFLQHYRLTDPALRKLAAIVRGADTHKPELAPEAAGLSAISLGLSRNFSDDHEMLRHGMTMYDALYAWSKEGQDEAHTWNPGAYR